ncbi:MAG: hypothetical protein FKY71_18010 [Spiribacter salinus]|uniref:Uncharacterized protein n=1 Tax=Spiribacter salinus TaxID=1335746 RepID=A0A540VAK9_9GAMM|nr:MAG: hypothetical protein FKY71_18010 [Spiribacter salinus]
MALEHEETIRARRKRGCAWQQIMRQHDWAAIAEDYGYHPEALKRVMAGRAVPKRLSDEDLRVIRHRRRMFRHAEYRWRKDSDKHLKDEYNMSTDTLYKILDREPEVPSAVASFLCGRLA